MYQLYAEIVNSPTFCNHEGYLIPKLFVVFFFRKSYSCLSLYVLVILIPYSDFIKSNNLK